MGISAIRNAGLSKARIEALTEGIFATVMTVLVLGLRTLPVGLSEADLKIQILDLWGDIVAYGFSFVVLGLSQVFCPKQERDAYSDYCIPWGL